MLRIAPGRAHQLQIIRGVTGSAFMAAVRYPGMLPGLRQILTGHEDRTHARMLRNVMIEVLARVGFVVHQEPGVPEAEVLYQQRIARERLVALVAHLHEPPPDVSIRLQLQGDPVRDSAHLSLPEKAVRSRTDAAARLRARDWQHHWLATAEAQVQATHASGDRRAERAVDHDPAALLHMLQGVHRPAGKDGDLKAGLVAGPSELEVVRAWCSQGSFLHGPQHALPRWHPDRAGLGGDAGVRSG